MGDTNFDSISAETGYATGASGSESLLTGTVYNATLAVANLTSIAAQTKLATDVTVTGAALGDFCLVTIDVDCLDLVITATVTAANTVTVVMANLEASTAVDLAAINIYVRVLSRA